MIFHLAGFGQRVIRDNRPAVFQYGTMCFRDQDIKSKAVI